MYSDDGDDSDGNTEDDPTVVSHRSNSYNRGNKNMLQ